MSARTLLARVAYTNLHTPIIDVIHGQDARGALADYDELVNALGALLGETLPRDTPAQKRARAAIAKAAQS